MTLKNDKAFYVMLKTNLSNRYNNIGLFDDLELLKLTKISIGKIQCVFDKDYINNILHKRIEEYKWELCYTGLISKSHLYERFMEEIYLPKLRYDVNMLKNKIQKFNQQED